MTAPNEKLSARQERGIAALLNTRNYLEAAKAAGVAEVTIRRWLKLPAFVAVYRSARRSLLEAAVGRLQRASDRAVEVLERNFDAPADPAVQVRSAKTVIDLAIRGIAELDLAERVDQLEQLERERKASWR